MFMQWARQMWRCLHRVGASGTGTANDMLRHLSRSEKGAAARFAVRLYRRLYGARGRIRP